MPIVNQVLTLLKEETKTTPVYRIQQNTGIKRDTLHNWLRGKTKPSLESAEILLDYFNKKLVVVDKNENC